MKSALPAFCATASSFPVCASQPMSPRYRITLALCIAALSSSSAFLYAFSPLKRRLPALHVQSNREDEARPSRFVQQEQLFEELSRKNAETIAALSISERTKRAMLAEAVEDEIFTVSEQIVDLVKQNEAQAIGLRAFEEQVRELKTRNTSLQKQYSDLVSGRPSSLLNSFDFVTVDGDNSMSDRAHPLNEDEFK